MDIFQADELMEDGDDLKMSIFLGEDNQVWINFGASVHGMSMNREEALKMADVLKELAEQIHNG